MRNTRKKSRISNSTLSSQGCLPTDRHSYSHESELARKWGGGGNTSIYRLPESGIEGRSQPAQNKQLRYEPFDAPSGMDLYREAVCGLCEKTVSLALDIPLDRFHARTRCNSEVALARQIAMYLCHTIFSLLLTEIGQYFRRDRTTVSYACAMVENRRDDLTFDLMLTQLESLLNEARNAAVLSIENMFNAQNRLGHKCSMNTTASDDNGCSACRGVDL